MFQSRIIPGTAAGAEPCALCAPSVVADRCSCVSMHHEQHGLVGMGQTNFVYFYSQIALCSHVFLVDVYAYWMGAAIVQQLRLVAICIRY